MAVARGTILAFGIFAASFALHIVGGATGHGWLFAIAVALIFVSATAFPVIAVLLGGFRDLTAPGARLTGAIGAIAGYIFTTGALWATNGRTFAWWEFPLAAVLVVASSAVVLTCWRLATARPQAAETTP